MRGSPPDDAAATRWLRRLAAAGLAVAAVVGAPLAGWVSPAAAYRPFDGTDAAVADVGEAEIELQPAGRLQTESERTLIAPQVVINYGFAERWEAVLQGQIETPLSFSEPSSLHEAAVLLKYVIQPGALQDKPGPSIATEFGVLLPGINAEDGVGASWSGIVSQRWEWGTVHLNIMTNLTRDQHGELFLGGIIEGPSKWTVRPVAEVFFDGETDGSQTMSGLIGAIWQVRDNLAVDVAVRYALVNGRPLNELRAGVTFGIPIGSAPAAKH